MIIVTKGLELWIDVSARTLSGERGLIRKQLRDDNRRVVRPPLFSVRVNSAVEFHEYPLRDLNARDFGAVYASDDKRNIRRFAFEEMSCQRHISAPTPGIGDTLT